ncbi:hypothetical protein RJ640_030161 [Escallonia rubra]|uniref:Helicase-like transcription factor CHR28 n=1 Tax=Escallonia rubra TaxID=112253 RepID=A0AA88QK07_9ASTE|nr:hypothetical protein RJ640_030161 [Escallonia rubra]
MADDNYWPPNQFSASDDADDQLSIDLDSLWQILDDPPDSAAQNRPDDSSLKSMGAVSEEASSVVTKLPGTVRLSASFNSEASDSMTRGSDGSVESSGNSVIFDCANLEPSIQNGSPVHSSSGSLTDWVLQVSSRETSAADRDVISQIASSCSREETKETQSEVPHRSTTFSFASGDSIHVSDVGGAWDSKYLRNDAEFEFRFYDVSDSSFNQSRENSGISHGTYCDSGEAAIGETSFMDVDIGYNSASYTQSSSCEFPGAISQASGQYSAMQYSMSPEDSFYFSPMRDYLPGNFILESVSTDDEIVGNIKEERDGLVTHNAGSSDLRFFDSQMGRGGGAVSEASLTGYSGVRGLSVKSEDGNLAWNTSKHSQPKVSCKNEAVSAKEEKDGELSQGASLQSFKTFDGVVRRKSSDLAELSVNKSLLQSLSSKSAVAAKYEREDVFLSSEGAHHAFDKTEDESCRKLIPEFCKKEETDKLTQFKNRASVSHQSVQGKALVYGSDHDDDSDICILEDLSEPACQSFSSSNGRSLVTPVLSSVGDPLNHMGVGGVRLKSNDERLVYRVALQDLSQPRSEATPPDGLVAVPLLRHQRIALAWMIQKEIASLNCRGGILADDQGLGKTISTIALLLTERSPSSVLCTMNNQKRETETLNLEDDEEGELQLDGSTHNVESCQVNTSRSSTNMRNPSVKTKGRPAAGTLVVCPTSVLRQWSEELHNKVTSKANLSILIYHGSNRTKDPVELAKFDVVLTTYAIVSMEVPKQPLADEINNETEKQNHGLSMGLSSSKKRKYPPSSTSRSYKGKKGMDSELFEAVARPLAKVEWFRVVLDEAQSIKNHRTQTARACWGLRAKRRWCLSGTPVQNSIDDLYSYFRFLKYEPYAAYKSFCSTIKAPIQKSPTKGYRKLQAVLKTFMLRRTKGTLLDGEPIICLPPKTIELKKVDFTVEERDFYCRLEADSRAQFAEYAAAGTVKQNYVNILLLLLRLRQACDHPLLVGGCGSNSVWRTSAETAKKLPREKQVHLLHCLEASLAICGICNDPPEDAAVTTCGHVFCNQCICEHLTGDEKQCPTADCKARLCVSSVFSRATLKSTLDHTGQESNTECSGAESGSSGTISSVGSFDSSKIKAALEFLQSLSKPCKVTSSSSSLISLEESSSCRRVASDPLPGKLYEDTTSNQKMDSCRGSNDLVSVVGEKAIVLSSSSLISVDESSSCPKKSSDPQIANKKMDLDRGSNDVVSVVGEKAIVFSQWTRMLDLLENGLKISAINYRRLDGTMSVAARDKAVKDFNNLPEVSVMIMSLKAASLGLNMVAACHVLLLDLWWNPTTEDQAIDRAHRIGQTRPVKVLRLTVKDTVEDRILALQQKKREMVSSAFGEDETGSGQTSLTVEDLNYLFSFNE